MTEASSRALPQPEDSGFCKQFNNATAPGAQLIKAVKVPDRRDCEALEDVRALIKKGVALDTEDESRTFQTTRRFDHYSALDWAAANRYNGTLLTLAQALTESDEIKQPVKRALLLRAAKFTSVADRDVADALHRMEKSLHENPLHPAYEPGTPRLSVSYRSMPHGPMTS